MKKINQKIQLIPVIELEPYDFKKGNYKSPSLNLNEAPKDWENYNQKCYKDSGLINLSSIRMGSWLFNLGQLDKSQLTIILKAIYNNTEKEHLLEIFKDPQEYAPFFCGGYLFTINEKIIAEPGCCCGLESISDWKDVITSKSGQVWTGHNIDTYVNFTVENNEIQFEVNDEVFFISLENYIKVIDDVESKLQQLIITGGDILNDLFDIQNGKEISRGMIYK